MGGLCMTDFIRNEGFLRQVTDFSGFAVRGQDVDFECDWGGKVFLRGDWKYTGGKLSGGQSIAAKHWVEAIGESHHAYFAIAEHAVPFPDTITAKDLTVRCVMFRTPEMSRALVVSYDDTYRPSWNLFVASLAQRYGYYGQMTPHACFDEEWFLDPVLSAAHDTPLGMQNRAVERTKLQDDLNRTTLYDDWVLPPDYRSSEGYRQDYLARPSVVVSKLPNYVVS